jgi:hypothetical protein
MRLALLALLAVGCGPSSYDDFRKKLQGEWVDWEVACGQIGESERASADVADPVFSFVEQDVNEDVDTAIHDGRIHFDSDGAQSCLDAIHGAPCDTAGLAAQIADGCHDVIKPALEPGARCLGGGECIGGVCRPSVGGCDGSCVAYRSPGVPCTPGDTSPENGCDPTVQFCGGTPTLCTPKKSKNEACMSDEECDYGYVCLGKCSDPPTGGNGDACTAPGTLCDLTIYCGFDGLCAKQKGAGATCLSANECKRGLACIGLAGTPSMPTAGTCNTWLDSGGGCSIGSMVEGCPASMSCNGTTCVSQSRSPGFGGACNDASGCQAGLYCDGTTCQFPVGRGGDCSRSPSSACAPGLDCDAAHLCSQPGC